MRRALESVRPYLGSHGGDVEILAIDGDEGVVALRMLGSCDGCASSSVTLELAVQRAIEEAAPEITRIDVVGGEAPTPRRPGSAVHAGHARAQARHAAPADGAHLRAAGARAGAGRARSRSRASS